MSAGGPVLVLVGPPAAGKSTVGRLVADRLGMPFTDTDDLVVQRAGKPVSEVFVDDGEEAFRELEAAAVADALATAGGLLALGGGAVLAAGTSDGPVAAEAALTARVFGAGVERVDDVGVAGLHRLIAARPALERAADTPPPGLGLPFDVWTSPRLAAYLAERTGVRLAPGWLRALLAARGFANGRPKHTLGHLQDPDEVAACEETLAAAEKKGGR